MSVRRASVSRARRRYRLLTSAACALAAAAVSAIVAGPTALDATLLDLEVAARGRSFAPNQVDESPVAVVAVDRRSLDSPELAAYPRVFLEPLWANALTAVMEAGAKVAAFDEIFAYDPNTFAGIGPKFAQPFLGALYKYRDRVVLARSATTLPGPAIRFQRRLRLARAHGNFAGF